MSLKLTLPIVLFVAWLCLSAQSVVSAVYLPQRSLDIRSSTASVTTQHTVSFTFPGSASVGSIKFEYCDSPLEVLSCVAPPGVDAAAAVLTAQSGETGFSVLSQTSNEVVLTRVPAATGSQLNSYTLNGVKNPSNIGSFYLRISSYASINATGPSIDFGGTVGAITQGISINTEVPPILEFCAAVSITSTCASASGNFVNLGTFSSNSTATGTTQFLVGTNANFGYVVTLNGNTLTSGNDVIAALSTSGSSQKGQSQFGMNLRANSNPPVGSDPAGGSGSPTANYGTPNIFRFNNGEIVASNSTVSDIQIYTASYIVNIGGGQAPGVYNTTLTYVATATF